MQIVSFAGSSYSIPNTRGDRPWSGLSDFVIAAASKAINTAGGSFTLLADINFGASFGLVSAYYTSRTTGAASAGQLRLASADTIKWRNNAGDGDVSLAKNSSNELLWNSSRIILAGGGLIVNADISASAAIAVSKLAALTASRAAVLDASGFLAAATTTAVEIGYVNGVTSAIQTQINTKAPAASPTFTGTIALPVTADRALQTGTLSVLEASAVTKTELGYVSGVTSSIQTQLNAAVANPLTGNLAAGNNKITGLAAGTASGDAVRFSQIFAGFQAPVQTVSNTGSATASATYVATNCTATITPTSASHRIKVTVSGCVLNSNTAGNGGYWTLYRAGANIGPASGFFEVTTTNNVWRGSCTISYIDSPATTSATTYVVYQKSDAGASIQFGIDGTQQVMILEEIV